MGRDWTIGKQIEMLRSSGGIAGRFHVWLLVFAGLLGGLAIAISSPVPAMFAFFFAVVGLAERRAGPNIRAALDALDHATPTEGTVTVTVTPGDTNDRYHCVVHGGDGPDWRFEFMAVGWRPVAGSCPARIWRTRPSGKPAVAVVDDGLMIPRATPKQVSGGGAAGA